MNKVGDVPRAHLHHEVSSEKLWLGTETYRATSVRAFPIDVPRPEPGSCTRGFAQRTVRCGFCGCAVELAIYDADRTRARRRRWLGLGLVGVGLVAVSLLVIVLAPQRPDVSVVVAFVVGVVMSGGFLRLWQQEDGVRYPLRSQRDSPGHSLRLHRQG